jgi:hypothetical protein
LRWAVEGAGEIIMPLKWYGILLLIFGATIFFTAAVNGKPVGILVGLLVGAVGAVPAFVKPPLRIKGK